MRKSRFLLFVCLFCLFLPLPFTFALSASSETDNAWTKLGRGLGNVTFGWVEIFYQPNQMMKTERWPIAIYGGIPKGAFYAVGRTLIGVYETATFPLAIPEGYQTMMEPEFILPGEI